mmetsp:Transcript_20719/g.25360  ORF Transcript_20719/g.25360 Transcript_20719/m.25360 type:complete len:92 (-) Transcript_20719:328-603(-)
MSATSYRSKIMTQDAGDPAHYKKYGAVEAYFTNRLTTYSIPSVGQIYRVQAQRQKVSFFNDKWWINFVPMATIFASIFGIEDAAEVITYDF